MTEDLMALETQVEAARAELAAARRVVALRAELAQLEEELAVFRSGKVPQAYSEAAAIAGMEVDVVR